MADPNAPDKAASPVDYSPIQPLITVVSLLQRSQFGEVLTTEGYTSLTDRLGKIAVDNRGIAGRLLLGVGLADPAEVSESAADSMWFGIGYEFVSDGDFLQLISVGLYAPRDGYNATITGANFSSQEHTFIPLQDVNWQKFENPITISSENG
jgi:hypothetical protein